MTIKDIAREAKHNWTERNYLIRYLKDYKFTAEQKKKINKVDPKFFTKLYNYPGDITTHRIHKVLNEV